MSVLLVTTRGDVVVDLACASAPRRCARFAALAALGRYDGALVHRLRRGACARAWACVHV